MLILALVLACPVLVNITAERRYPIPRRIPPAGTQNTRGWENLAIF